MGECRREEKQKILSERELVSLSDLTKNQKKKFQLTCLKAKTSGIFAYDNCLHDELVELGLREPRPQPTREPASTKGAETPSKPKTPSKPETPSIPVTQTEYGTAQKLSTSSLVAQLEKGTVLILSKGGLGSGFFISPGLVLTNRHVIEEAQGTVFITNQDMGLVQPAKVIVMSTKMRAVGQLDLALLSVVKNQAHNFTFSLNLAPNKLESVIAAGYPGSIIVHDELFYRLIEGDASAAPALVMTRGEISANQRSRDGIHTLVHTAQIMPGNSGGPLVDGCGRVVGINTFITFDEDKPETGNAGFALSSQELHDFLEIHKVTVSVDKKTCED